MQNLPEYLFSPNWLTGFKNGIEKDFELFYRSMVRPLVGFAIKRGFRKDEAEDFVSEAFGKVYENRMKYADFNHVRRSAFTILSNKLIDVYKIKNKERAFFKENKYLWREIDETYDMDYDMKLAALAKAIRKLPPQRKNIIKGLFVEGLTAWDLVKKLKISRQTVLNHKTKAINTMMIQMTGSQHQRFGIWVMKKKNG